MVCGKCWKTVSGGVVDGDDEHPDYRCDCSWLDCSLTDCSLCKHHQPWLMPSFAWPGMAVCGRTCTKQTSSLTIHTKRTYMLKACVTWRRTVQIRTQMQCQVCRQGKIGFLQAELPIVNQVIAARTLFTASKQPSHSRDWMYSQF